MPATAHFADRLAAAMERTGTIACVGLDPVLDKLPPELLAANPEPPVAIAAFCRGVLDSIATLVPAVKFQSACFERHGFAGVFALEQCIHHARTLGLVVLLDAKRGDIGISAEHYAAAVFAGDSPADALTISPYLGPDTIEPFLKHAPEKGLFTLVRTSNPGSDSVQHLFLQDGRTIAEAMADMVSMLGSRYLNAQGISSLGAVVGATKRADAVALRARMPDQLFLVPGYGAQGGTADDVRAMLRPGRTDTLIERGVLVTASRSVVFPGWSGGSKGGWMADVHAAAKRLTGELTQILK